MIIIEILALTLFGFIIFAIIKSGVEFWQDKTEEEKKVFTKFILWIVAIMIFLMIFGA
jgi:Na+/proline symporter